MKRVILIMLALIAFVLVNAQNYKVDFSVNKEKAIANYKIKNCTKYDLYLVRTHDANLSAGCHCAINYENKDGHLQYEILCCALNYSFINTKRLQFSHSMIFSVLMRESAS